MSKSESEVEDMFFARAWFSRVIVTKDWDETKHQRHGKGSDKGGEFAPKETPHTPAPNQAKLPFREKMNPHVASDREPVIQQVGETVPYRFEPKGPIRSDRPTVSPEQTRDPAANTHQAKRDAHNEQARSAYEKRFTRLIENLPPHYQYSEADRTMTWPDGTQTKLPNHTRVSLRILEQRLTMAGHDPNELAPDAPKPKPFTGAPGEGVQPGQDEQKPANKPTSEKEKKTVAPISPEEHSAKNKIEELAPHLPEGYRMSTTGNAIWKPDGKSVPLIGSAKEKLDEISRVLQTDGHDVESLIQIGQATAKLKEIGAEWLDDVTPTETGSLIQRRQSSASSNVNDVPRDDMTWDDLDSYTQEGILENWRELNRDDIKNDSDLHDMWRTQAEESADQELDSLSNEDIAREIHEDLIRQEGFEKYDLKETQAALDSGDETAVDLRDSYVVSRRDELIDEMMEGDWLNDQVTNELDAREENTESSEFEQYARDGGMFEDVSSGDSEVSSLLDDFGIDAEELPSMVGAPDNWHMDISYDSEHGNGGVRVAYNDGRNRMERVLHRDENGDLVVHNEYFRLADNAPKGLGAKIFSEAVASAREMGITKFYTHAAKDESFVGYAVWPTFGYDQALEDCDSSTVRKARQDFPDAETVRDIFDQPGGDKWWWKNGSSMYNAEFYLTDGSRNLTALQSYLQNKKRIRDEIRNSIKPSKSPKNK